MRGIQFTQRFLWLAAAGVLSLSCAALSAQAADKDHAKAKPVELEAITQSGAELSAELGEKWGRVLAEGYGLSERGLTMFVNGYANYPKDVLKSALSAKNFEAMNRALMDHNQQLVNALAEKISNEEGTMDVEIHKIKREMTKALGDEARDLVYIPIAPCRTFDTRTALFGGFNGVVVPGTPKNALVVWPGASSGWISYGGTVDSCPETTTGNINGLAGAFPYAVAFNLTVITPVGTGWATVYRGDLADPSLTVVSKFVQSGLTDTGLVVANTCRGATGASCVNDIKIATRNTTAHVAGDVVGYFIKPQATALQCTTVEGTVVNVGANTYASLTSALPACAAGYTRVGVEFFANADVLKADSGLDYLFVRNVGATASSVTPKAHCCRVPGR